MGVSSKKAIIRECYDKHNNTNIRVIKEIVTDMKQYQIYVRK